MYEQIAKNKRASVLLLVLMVAVFLGLGYFIALIWASPGVGRAIILVLCALGASVWALVAYYGGAPLLLAMSGAHEVDHREQAQLWNVTHEMSIAAGLPMPKVYLIDDDAPNALATGRDPQHASVAVTSGLLAMMDRQELQGVLAHEISHVRNYDIRFATVVCAMVGVVAFAGMFFLHLSIVGFRVAGTMGAGSAGRRRDRETGAGVIVFLMLALAMFVSALAAGLAFICSYLLELAISRRREYLADASAVQLARDPIALARALEKIAAYPEPLAAANPATAPLYIADPFKKLEGWTARLLDTHPPIEKRIAVLRAIGHEPPRVKAGEGRALEKREDS